MNADLSFNLEVGATYLVEIDRHIISSEYRRIKECYIHEISKNCVKVSWGKDNNGCLLDYCWMYLSSLRSTEYKFIEKLEKKSNFNTNVDLRIKYILLSKKIKRLMN